MIVQSLSTFLKNHKLQAKRSVKFDNNYDTFCVIKIMNHYTRIHTCRIMGIILYAFHEPSISRVLLSHGSMELFTTT